MRSLFNLICVPVLLALLMLLPGTSSAAVFADQGSAYQACMTDLAGHSAWSGGKPVTTACLKFEGWPQYTCYGYQAAGAQIVGCSGKSGIYIWPLENTCEKRPDWNGPYPYLTGGAPRNGSVTCNAGCKQAWYSTGDGYFNGKYTSVPGTCNEYDDQKCKAEFGNSYYFNKAMSSCEPEAEECPGGAAANSLGKCEPEPCPAGKVQQPDGTCRNKENECPAGNVKSPDGKCLPGDGQCAEGEVRGEDGTCKRDSNDDGEPDEPGEGETEKEAFSGGDECNTPPSCSGSVILCGQARIQWRIECNTRKNRNIAGGACSTQPICTGEKCDALEYSGLLMQWRTACAAEKMARNSGTGDSGLKDHLTAMKKAEVDALRALGQDDGHGNVDPTKMWGNANLEDKINEGLFGGGGGTCDLSFTIGGNVVVPPPQFWRIIQIIHWLMVASAYLWVSFQLSK